MKRRVRDSVFRAVFREEQYQKSMILEILGESYLGLPVTDVTLDNVFGGDRYNDLGLQVGNQLLIMMEAQSTLPTNTDLRMLTYITRTLEQVAFSKNNMFGSKRVMVPAPRAYVVYTGDAKVPKKLRLTDHFHENGTIEMVTYIITKDMVTKPGALWQYARFCDICKGGSNMFDREAYAQWVISTCEREGILTDFINKHRSEIGNYTLEDLMWEKHLECMRNESREEGLVEGRAEGRAEGIAQGRAEGMAQKEADLIAKLSSKLNMSTEELKAMLDQDSDGSGNLGAPSQDNTPLSKMPPLE